MQPTPERRIIRPTQVYTLVARSRSQIWRDVRNGTFPAPIELGPNAIGWFLDEVERWLADRPRRNKPDDRQDGGTAAGPEE